MRGTRDLLHQLADEHRDLTDASRRLHHLLGIPGDALRSTAARIVEHELAHRLLVHPLLRRDRRGRKLFSDRREEQLLLADRLGRTLALAQADPQDPDVARTLDLQLVEHTDREEILEFPHLRHITSGDELVALGELHAKLRAALRHALERDDSLVVDGSWASAPRSELPELLQLPEDLVIVLPDAEPRTLAGR
jgi:hypothetical protein